MRKCTGPKTAGTIIRTSYFLKIDCGILINDIGDRDQGMQNGKQWEKCGLYLFLKYTFLFFSLGWKKMG